MTQLKMSKKQAHILFLFLFNIPSLFIISYFYNEINNLFLATYQQSDMVSFNSKEGFFILFIIAPIVQLIGIIEYFWFDFIKRHTRTISYGFLTMIILLFVSAITISSFIKAKVEHAGYINCEALKWYGTYSVSYTYTRNQAICEQLVAEQVKEKK